MRRMRVGLKTVLVLIAVFGVYLAWRIHDPEQKTLSAIHEAGGKAYYGYQQPCMGSSKAISVAQLPGFVYYSQHDVACVGQSIRPKLTLSEVLFGNGKQHRITAVELPIGQLTPELETRLHSLADLQFVVVEMPAMMANSECVEVKRLDELEEKFGDRVWPTVKLGL